MLGDKIKEWRELRGMTQAELGEHFGMSSAAISSWEKGRTEPNMKNLEKLAQILRCEKSDLVEEAKRPVRDLAFYDELVDRPIYIEVCQELKEMDDADIKRLIAYLQFMKGGMPRDNK